MEFGEKLDMIKCLRQCCAQRMQLTGTIYNAKRGVWSMWMTRRVSRPAWQTDLNCIQPGQQEETT